MPEAFDAVLLVSFGGPEGPEDVMPFLENVLRGKNVPRERMMEVAGHYHHFGGVSPINEENRRLMGDLSAELERAGIGLPVYWGNRNWRPYLEDALSKMRDDGVRSALGLVTSAFGSYSGCRQYLENIEAAQERVGPEAPVIFKLRNFFNHPGFIEAMADRVRTSLSTLPEARRRDARLVYTAHSIPMAMAQSSPYETQLHEACRLVSEAVGYGEYQLVWQSRSGPPQQAWLEPDVSAVIRAMTGKNRPPVALVPIGFLCDHLEVLYDLDVEAAEACREAGLTFVRVPTVGRHPRFVQGLRELIQERLAGAPRRALGSLGPAADECPADCCRWRRA